MEMHPAEERCTVGSKRCVSDFIRAKKNSLTETFHEVFI